MVEENSIHEVIKSQFKDHFKRDVSFYEPLSSHGSDRRIIRLKANDGLSAIGIVHNNSAENKAFILFSKHFRKSGLRVPHIYSVSDDLKYYLMEDLGDITFAKLLTHRKSVDLESEHIELYKKSIDELLKFQIEAGRSVDYNLCYQFNEFGEKNIDFDLNYFKERFLKNFYTSFDETRLNTGLNCIKEKVLTVSADYFLYRDFQSRNIMLKDKELYFIDYQSGRKGPLQYDIASLLYDAKADIPQQVREELLDYYLEKAAKYVQIKRAEFINTFWYFALVRILQAMGAYGFLGVVKGKERFLESIPYAVKNVNLLLNEKINKDELGYLRIIFEELKYDKV